MMGILEKFPRNHLEEFIFNLSRRLPRRQAGSVSDAKHVGIDGHNGFAKSGAENDVRRLAPNARKFLEFGAGPRYFTLIMFCKNCTGLDDIRSFSVAEINGLDVLAQRRFAEFE